MGVVLQIALAVLPAGAADALGADIVEFLFLLWRQGIRNFPEGSQNCRRGRWLESLWAEPVVPRTEILAFRCFRRSYGESLPGFR